jgi:SOS-response transcriptional repressor LexA
MRIDAARNQAKVLNYIRSYTTEYRMPPSMREIAAGCGIAYVTVHQRIKRLVKEGKLRPTQGRARGYVLAEEE